MPDCLHAVESHCFRQGGQDIVLDVRTSRVFAISRLQRDILAAPEGSSPDTLYGRLGVRCPDEEISLALERLSKCKLLLPHPDLGEKIRELTFPAITRLQLSAAQDCNLRCRYCIVEQGSFGEPRQRMSGHVARQAVDLLMCESREAAQCTLGFSGGEPMLNWEVVRDAIAYSREQAVKHGKQVQYFLKTNGTLLDEGSIAFIKEQRIDVFFSLDGPPAAHDGMRPMASGRGSHDVAAASLAKLLAECAEHVFLRTTLTRFSPPLPELLDYLIAFGARSVGFIRVMARDEDYALGTEALEQLKEGCTQLARRFVSGAPADYATPFITGYLQQLSPGKRPRPSVRPGGEYLVVSASGGLYPHPALAEKEEYRLGHVSTGLDPEKLAWWRFYLNVDNRPVCRDCWARYLCDGGCFPAAVKIQGTPDQPMDAECEMIRHLIELAIWVYLTLRERRVREVQDATRGLLEGS